MFPQRIWALNRGHIVFFFSFFLFLSFFLPASLEIEYQHLKRAGKYVVEFSRQADGIKGVPFLQSDAHQYSLMTHSWASFNGKHNFGFLRREGKKKRKRKSWRALAPPNTKILGRNMTSTPFANVSVFPYVTKILFFSLSL